ncbi:alpha/beta hydrolase family protein [Inhella gelatinilytica]|uniref:Alpha/beta fold hydrolase n=1 Tax=Inhella gelatinilytica TaxID=2795030 RepID=A0A931IYT6_9BURK|nr:alpha/beta fold hydrolase [Inhella gelatinilytica]MBH9552316.1 alpha/beta fold hydrolase [Inhella gelatinilytica]
MRDIQFQSGDGTTLVARLFTPEGPARAAVLLAPAMGVTQGYYAELARWLAGEGFAVQTFDFRGMGASRPARHARSLRGFQAGVKDWVQDMDAALLHLQAQVPGAPLLLIGHSLGGQLPGLLPSRDRLAGLVGIAAGSGYWAHQPEPQRSRARWFWRWGVPLATSLYGYFPGAKLKLIGDLPLGVIQDWKRWCSQPGYLLDDPGLREHYRGFQAPFITLHVADDEMLSETSLRTLYDGYAGAREREFMTLTPPPGGRIGHLGFFRPQHAATLWPVLLQQLQRLSGAQPP